MVLGKWIFVTHSLLSENDVDKMVIWLKEQKCLFNILRFLQIENINNEIEDCNEIYLKFEPFILHVFVEQ